MVVTLVVIVNRKPTYNYYIKVKIISTTSIESSIEILSYNGLSLVIIIDINSLYNSYENSLLSLVFPCTPVLLHCLFR